MNEFLIAATRLRQVPPKEFEKRIGWPRAKVNLHYGGINALRGSKQLIEIVLIGFSGAHD